MRHRVARGGALAVSLALGGFVIVNAQLGCDAPASTAPPPASPEKKAEPEKQAEPATKVEPAATAELPNPNAEPAAKAEVEPPPEPGGSPKEGVKVEPVYMPASKSGGDFGAMQFPGQGQINPAPNAAPSQQAVQE